MREFLFEWVPVIGLVGPLLVGWLWWSVRKAFTPKDEHAHLVARVAQVEANLEDVPDNTTMLKIQLSLEELRGNMRAQDTKIDGVAAQMGALNHNVAMLLQHHLDGGKP